MNTITKRMMSTMFTKVDGLVWSLTTGQLGVVVGDSGVRTLKYTTDVSGNLSNFSICESLFEVFGMPIPAFATRAGIDDIKPASLVVVGGKIYWVVSKSGDLLKVLNQDGIVTELASTNITGFDGNTATSANFMLVKPLIDVLGGSDSLNGFSSNIMPLVLMSQMGDGKTTFDMEKMIPFMIMSGGNVLGNGNMFQTIMLMQALKGGNGGNFF